MSRFQREHFNPLPPHGGRPSGKLKGFLGSLDFNPLPPHGGRLTHVESPSVWRNFNPLPPHGGRQQNCTGKRFSFRLSLYNPAKKDAKDYILHPKKWFFSKKGRKIWCETFSIFLCAYDSHRHFSLKFLSQNQRLFHAADSVREI